MGFLLFSYESSRDFPFIEKSKYFDNVLANETITDVMYRPGNNKGSLDIIFRGLNRLIISWLGCDKRTKIDNMKCSYTQECDYYLCQEHHPLQNCTLKSIAFNKLIGHRIKDLIPGRYNLTNHYFNLLLDDNSEILLEIINNQTSADIIFEVKLENNYFK
jgi:hypothetical protein